MTHFDTKLIVKSCHFVGIVQKVNFTSCRLILRLFIYFLLIVIYLVWEKTTRRKAGCIETASLLHRVRRYDSANRWLSRVGVGRRRRRSRGASLSDNSDPARPRDVTPFNANEMRGLISRVTPWAKAIWAAAPLPRLPLTAGRGTDGMTTVVGRISLAAGGRSCRR